MPEETILRTANEQSGKINAVQLQQKCITYKGELKYELYHSGSHIKNIIHYRRCSLNAAFCL